MYETPPMQERLQPVALATPRLQEPQPVETKRLRQTIEHTNNLIDLSILLILIITLYFKKSIVLAVWYEVGIFLDKNEDRWANHTVLVTC